MLVHTVQNPWMKIRDEVSAVDTLMTKDGAGGTPKKHWADRDTTMGVTIPLGANGIMVGLMGDDEDSDVTITIWVYSERGPAQWVAGLTYKIGGQEVVEDPTTNEADPLSLKYGDTITIVDQGWPNRFFNLIDSAGDDGVACAVFEGAGAKFLKVEISALDAGLEVIPIFRYW